MSRILFLIPPSEWKKLWWENRGEKLSFSFEKPMEIASMASEKDLKCSGKRYEEALFLNRNLWNSPTLPAIDRYTGVMYDHIWYFSLDVEAKEFFDQHFLILSGMYWLLRPKDRISNYKLPIETKGLLAFWGEKVIDEILALKPEKIYNLLPLSYEKMLCLKKKEKILIQEGIELIKPDFSFFNGEKATHNTKILRGMRIRQVCEQLWANL